MVSIVVPVLNEQESLPAFYDTLSKIAPTLAKSYEIIFIDDGSTDKSLDILMSFAQVDKTIRIFSFRRNLGKAEALSFGFIKALGEYVVTLDADLQDKPSEIPKLLEKAKQGTEVVCGWRKNRKDTLHMVIVSKISNFILQRVFELKIHDYNCGLKVYRREAAKSLHIYGGLHRFIPLIAYEQGFVVDEVAVDHQKRKFGKSKYNFSKYLKEIPDLFSMYFLTKYSKRPLHFFGILGELFILIGLAFLTYLTVIHYVFGKAIGDRPIFLMGILFVVAGLQTFFTGFIADLVISISHNKEMLDESHAHFPLKYTSDKKE